MSDKLAFIFPGYNLSPDRESYRQIKEFYSSNGFEPTILDIEWSRDFWENVELFRSALSDQLENYQNPEIHFFGHSWGAASALVLSQDIGLETQLLAGLSPVFREDRELLSTVETFTFQAREYFYSVLKETPETVEKRPVLAEISSENIGKIVLLYGETEYYGPLGIRALGLPRSLTEGRCSLLDTEEIVVAGAGHFMNEEYIEVIGQKITVLPTLYL